MKTKEGFEIILASPSDRESLVAEIHYKDLFVCLISQEHGTGTFELEAPGSNETNVARRVDLNGLQIAIELACQKLKGK